MIFKDKLKEVEQKLEGEFGKLLQLALQNQSHPGDVLLLVLNGWKEPKMEGVLISGGKPASPYVIGPGSSGHSDSTHYEFIHEYRKNISKLTYPEYLKLHEWSPERKEEIDKLLFEEGISIHLETLVYIKIWEGDFFIKFWYQFVRILKGEPYDWHFKVKSSNRGDGIATRQDLIRLFIRDELKNFSEPIYEAFKDAYLTQVRNAIAHSNFSFLGRNMHLHNFIEKDPSHQLQNLEFDKWVQMFHTTIILHNFSIWLKNNINSHYGQFYLENPDSVEIRITKDNGEERFSLVEFRPDWQDWKWKSK